MNIEQIAIMAASAKTLKMGGALAVAIAGNTVPEVQVNGDFIADAIRATGERVYVEKHGSGSPYWQGSIAYAGALFFALIGDNDLPRIGYHLVDGHPVPITDEEVR